MIFVDTGAFVARFVESDQYHKRARAEWSRIEKRRERCLTSNFVLDETFTLLAIIFDRMGIRTSDVLAAAGTK